MALPFHVFTGVIWRNISVKTIPTAKLKLQIIPEAYIALRATVMAYRDALNYASRVAFENEKIRLPSLTAGITGLK